jgi:hypothetical protein
MAHCIKALANSSGAKVFICSESNARMRCNSKGSRGVKGADDVKGETPCAKATIQAFVAATVLEDPPDPIPEPPPRPPLVLDPPLPTADS